MTVYRVAHKYAAVYRSQQIGFDAGAAVEVDDEVAAWVNRDSPGCLAPADAPAPVEPEPDPEPQEPVGAPAAKSKRGGRRAG